MLPSAFSQFWSLLFVSAVLNWPCWVYAWSTLKLTNIRRTGLWSPTLSVCMWDLCPPCHLYWGNNACEASCNDVLLVVFLLRVICFSLFFLFHEPTFTHISKMHCLCNSWPTAIHVMSIPPLTRSCYLSVPLLFPLVRDIQGYGSRNRFSTFSPDRLNIRIQTYRLTTNVLNPVQAIHI